MYELDIDEGVMFARAHITSVFVETSVMFARANITPSSKMFVKTGTCQQNVWPYSLLADASPRRS